MGGPPRAGAQGEYDVSRPTVGGLATLYLYQYLFLQQLYLVSPQQRMSNSLPTPRVALAMLGLR